MSRILMLAPAETALGPLPKLVPLLADGIRRLGSEVVILPWGRRAEDDSLFRKVVTRTQDVVAIRRVATLDRYPVVVVHTAHTWSSLIRDAILLMALRRRILIFHFHGSQSPRLVQPGSRLFKWMTARVVSRADGIFVLSTIEQQEWLRFAPRMRALVVRNPVPHLPKAEHANGDPRPTVLCVSRLMVGKGVLDLVHATAIIKRRTPCRLVLAGVGPAEGSIRSLARALGVERSVELCGYVNGDTLSRLYASATVFALPTSLSEGFPTSILEAMSFGLPIVTTGSRGPADHLEDGKHALFVRPHDPEGLAAALSRVLADPQLRERMGQANRRKAQDFDIEIVAQSYLAAIQAIAKNG